LAFNLQTFKTRALTALLFVAVMLTGLLWNFWSFLILFTIIHFGCWFEFVKLMKNIYGKQYLRYCLFGLIYITLPCSLMICLYSQLTDIHIYDTYIVLAKGSIPIVIIAGIWINDTMAYLVGSFIGKTPLSKISPRKTIEGTLGGIILCIAAIGVFTRFIFDERIITYCSMIIAALCAIFGTLGDLLESKLKRMADVKDSGSFMPGHGGFLDRFDSLLVAVPAVWLFIYFISG
jgi:phosphatidate cytidylyltransferase